MKVILMDKTELTPIMVTGAKKYVSGANRDALSFVFADNISMDELDGIFTEANCESVIIIGDDESEAIHNAYTVRVELIKTSVVVSAETPENAEVKENRVTVTMAQRTYMETKLKEIEAMLANK